MKEYKVVDLSYSQDPRQHLKDVRAYHELDGWQLLTVVHLQASGRWLYYLERDAQPGPRGVVATPVGNEQSLPAPVRRVERGSSGEVVTAGADVLKDGVILEVRSRPGGGVSPELGEPGPVEYRAQQAVRVPPAEGGAALPPGRGAGAAVRALLGAQTGRAGGLGRRGSFLRLEK